MSPTQVSSPPHLRAVVYPWIVALIKWYWYCVCVDPYPAPTRLRTPQGQGHWHVAGPEEELKPFLWSERDHKTVISSVFLSKVYFSKDDYRQGTP